MMSDVLAIVGVSLAMVSLVYAVVSQRKPNRQLDALYNAILQSPDFKTTFGPRGEITSIRAITGSAAITLPRPQVSATGTVSEPEHSGGH